MNVFSKKFIVKNQSGGVQNLVKKLVLVFQPRLMEGLIFYELGTL